MPFLRIVGVIALFLPIKLITDNLLYAAMIRRLKSEFGIEEESMVAFFTTNLAPILVTLGLALVIYRVSSAQHRTPLMREHSRTVDRALDSLGVNEIEWVRSNYAGGRPPSSLGDALFTSGLIDRDHTGFTEVKEYLKPVLARRLSVRQRRATAAGLAKKLEPKHLIVIGLTGMIIFAAIALGGVIRQSQVAPVTAADPRVGQLQSQLEALTKETAEKHTATASELSKSKLALEEKQGELEKVKAAQAATAKDQPVPAPSGQKKIKPVYVRNISVSPQGNDKPLLLHGTLAVTQKERLRVIVRHVMLFAGRWQDKFLTEYEAITEPIEGQFVERVLVTRHKVDNVGTDLWWGDYKANYPLPQPGGVGMNELWVMFRIRISVIGPDGPQDHDLTLLRLKDGDGPQLSILPPDAPDIWSANVKD